MKVSSHEKRFQGQFLSEGERYEVSLSMIFLRMCFSKISTTNSSDNFQNISKRNFQIPVSLRLSLQIDQIKTCSKMFVTIARADSYDHFAEYIFSLHRAFFLNNFPIRDIGLKTLQITFQK